MEPRRSKTARIWLGEDGIVRFVSVGVESTAETVAESLEIVREVTAGGRPPILFDARSWPRGDPASWVRFISMIEDVSVAAAVIVSSESAPAMGSFPSYIDGLVIPFRIFEDEDSALEFLAGYL